MKYGVFETTTAYLGININSLATSVENINPKEGGEGYYIMSYNELGIPTCFVDYQKLAVFCAYDFGPAYWTNRIATFGDDAVESPYEKFLYSTILNNSLEISLGLYLNSQLSDNKLAPSTKGDCQISKIKYRPSFQRINTVAIDNETYSFISGYYKGNLSGNIILKDDLFMDENISINLNNTSSVLCGNDYAIILIGNSDEIVVCNSSMVNEASGIIKNISIAGTTSNSEAFKTINNLSIRDVKIFGMIISTEGFNNEDKIGLSNSTMSGINIYSSIYNNNSYSSTVDLSYYLNLYGHIVVAAITGKDGGDIQLAKTGIYDYKNAVFKAGDAGNGSPSESSTSDQLKAGETGQIKLTKNSEADNTFTTVASTKGYDGGVYGEDINFETFGQIVDIDQQDETLGEQTYTNVTLYIISPKSVSCKNKYYVFCDSTKEYSKTSDLIAYAGRGNVDENFKNAFIYFWLTAELEPVHTPPIAAKSAING